MTDDYPKNAAGKCVLCWGNGIIINHESKTVKCYACGSSYVNRNIETRFLPRNK